jgi:hypothetical protein
MRISLLRASIGAIVLATALNVPVETQAGWRYSYNGHRYWAGGHSYGGHRYGVYYRGAAHLGDFSVAGTVVGAANLSPTYGYNNAYPGLYEGVPPASAYSYGAGQEVVYHSETRVVTVPVVSYRTVIVPETTYQTVQETVQVPEVVSRPPAPPTCRCSY